MVTSQTEDIFLWVTRYLMILWLTPTVLKVKADNTACAVSEFFVVSPYKVWEKSSVKRSSGVIIEDRYVSHMPNTLKLCTLWMDSMYAFLIPSLARIGPGSSI